MSAFTTKIALTAAAAALAVIAQQPFALGAQQFLMLLAGGLVGGVHVPQPGTAAKLKARTSQAPE